MKKDLSNAPGGGSRLRSGGKGKGGFWTVGRKRGKRNRRKDGLPLKSRKGRNMVVNSSVCKREKKNKRTRNISRGD